MNNEFHQRLAVVTGASTGIGLAVTLGLLERGAQVVAMARHTAGLGELAERFGEKLFLLPGDVTLAGDQVRLAQLTKKTARCISLYPMPE